jgi:hypothetical protein
MSAVSNVDGLAGSEQSQEMNVQEEGEGEGEEKEQDGGQGSNSAVVSEEQQNRSATSNRARADCHAAKSDDGSSRTTLTLTSTIEMLAVSDGGPSLEGGQADQAESAPASVAVQKVDHPKQITKHHSTATARCDDAGTTAHAQATNDDDDGGGGDGGDRVPAPPSCLGGGDDGDDDGDDDGEADAQPPPPSPPAATSAIMMAVGVLDTGELRVLYKALKGLHARGQCVRYLCAAHLPLVSISEHTNMSALIYAAFCRSLQLCQQTELALLSGDEAA